MDIQAPISDVAIYCRQVRERSREHREAMSVATEHGWSSVAVGILRQEVDSMVRTIFLNSQSDDRERARLLALTISGKKWSLPTPKGNFAQVTDRTMVDYAQNLHGWTRMVYDFGCKFIHLSDCHDYNARDPFQALPPDERGAIARYLRKYHGGSVSSSSTFNEVAEYFPKVLKKISDNMEWELKALESASR